MAAARRARLDSELVRRGLASSRAQARRLVTEGRVTVAGAPASKPAAQVAPGEALHVLGPQPAYASRGGHKLAAALAALGVEVAGRHCLDAGASTGGFTDVLLRAGAARVVAVDVGYGQLAWRLRTDERVVVRDRTNVRLLEPQDLPPPPCDLVVADLSFVSLAAVLPALRRVASAGAEFVVLVKPQFEAGREHVGRGGVVRDPGAWEVALRRVARAAGDLGLATAGACASPLPGPAGNVEFFLHLRPGAGAADAAGLPGAGGALDDLLRAAVDEGRRLVRE